MLQIRQYTTASGRNPFLLWLESVKSPHTQAIIAARMDRLEAGNFGDSKPVGQGVTELRIDHGPGYRIYCARVGPVVVLLLCGGEKRRQTADIEKAIEYLSDYKRRSKES